MPKRSLATKISSVVSLKTMKEIVQKEADSRNNLTKKQDELIATKKELDLLNKLEAKNT